MMLSVGLTREIVDLRAQVLQEGNTLRELNRSKAAIGIGVYLSCGLG